MSTNAQTWRAAPPPNYFNSENKNYLYSEQEYDVLVKKPLTNVRLIDFWGEGYIAPYKGDTVSSGFKSAYNINHQYQLVSNGEDKDRKIPNRIPTKNYENVNVKKFVNDSCVEYITLMNAPLTNPVAKEIARMLNKDYGTFLFLYADAYDDEVERTIVPALEEVGVYGKVTKKFLDLCGDPKINQELSCLHNYKYLVFMAAGKIVSNKNYIKEASIHAADLAALLRQLYKKNKEYHDVLIEYFNQTDSACLLDIMEKLCELGQCSIKDHQMITEEIKDIAAFLCKKGCIINYIGNSLRGKYELISAYFQREYDSIYKMLNGKPVTILNLEYEMYLKLPVKMVDKDKDKPAYGGAKHRGLEKGQEDRFLWTVKREDSTIENTCYFSITNKKFGMPLKLPKQMVDKDKDKPAYGGCKERAIEKDGKDRFYWYIKSTILYGRVFFYLYNKKFNMPLKLPIKMVDKNGDKPAYGGSAQRGVESGQERRFIWHFDTLGD